jgi:hypothetical protein
VRDEAEAAAVSPVVASADPAIFGVGKAIEHLVAFRQRGVEFLVSLSTQRLKIRARRVE